MIIGLPPSASAFYEVAELERQLEALAREYPEVFDMIHLTSKDVVEDSDRLSRKIIEDFKCKILP